MTDIDLDALEATARAATPSEWHVEGSKFHDSYGHGLGQTFGTYWRQNAEYIAAFDPPTVLALISRLKRREAIGRIASEESRRADRAEARLREAEACIEAVADELDRLEEACVAVPSKKFFRTTIDAYKTTKTEGGAP